jgi:hypothetical protein
MCERRLAMPQTCNMLAVLVRSQSTQHPKDMTPCLPCCRPADRLVNVEVRMGPHDPTVGLQARNNPVCAFWRGPGVSGTAHVNISCISTVPAARYLSIQLLNAPDVLTMCEVQWTFAALT